jgi:hypothetical protein
MGTPAAPAPLQAMDWVKVPGTRRQGDEILVGFAADGVLIRNSLVDPGLAITFDDLRRVGDFVLGEDGANGP